MAFASRSLMTVAFLTTAVLAAGQQLRAQTVINTVQDLQNMQANTSGTYVLGGDIDASATQTWNAGQGFIPVGSYSAPFTGSLDGQGHTIKGLYIYSALPAVGLFGRLGSTARVQNFTLTGANITSTGGICGGGSATCVGAVAGWSDGPISRVTVNAVINTSGDVIAGGLVGVTHGNVSNDQASGSLNDPDPNRGSQVGGLIGENFAAISGSVATMAVSVGGATNVGGLVGWNGGAITSSSASGAVKGTGSSDVGGLVGANISSPAGTIYQSSASGPVTIGYGGLGGGLVGINYNTIQQSFATGPVNVSGAASSDSTSEGGLVGANGGTISQSYSTGSVIGNFRGAIAGLVGTECLGSVPVVTQSYSIGLVQGPSTTFIGGLIGATRQIAGSNCAPATGSTTTFSYWDTQTSSLSASPAGGTGEMTAVLKSGTLPSGFDGSVWATSTGIYPYLIWQGAPPIIGYVDPKYIVLGVTYSPPGGQASFVQYQNSTLVGNSQSLSQSFANGTTFSVSLSNEVSIFSVANGTISTMFSTTASQTIKNTSAVQTSLQVQQGEKTFGNNASIFAPVNHDPDMIWVWLNPAIILSLYPNNSVVWNGYGFDATDTLAPSAMDVVGIPLGYLNGDYGPIPPDLQKSITRGWAAGQTFPPGQGPALTNAELAQIAASDPFFDITYGPKYIGTSPPSPSTLDGRFTLSSCGNEPIPYNQSAPSGTPSPYTCTVTYTNTLTQSQENTKIYSQMFSVDAQLKDSGFIDTLTIDLKDSNTLTWTTDSQTSTTNTSVSTAALSVQGPPCGNAVVGQGPCIPVYDASGSQPVQFDVYQDNLYGTFMFAPINYTWPSALEAQTITFGPLSTVNLPASPIMLNATASSGLTVTFASTTLSICTVSGNTVTAVSAGTCSITATQSGNSTWTAATPVTQSFTIKSSGLQSQTITFGALSAVTLPASPITLNATASSGLAVTFASTTLLVCTVSGNTLAAVSAGICSITATQLGNSTWAAATPVTQSFIIVSGGLTILTVSPLPGGAVGIIYSQGLASTGGVTPYKGWSLSSGSTLPPGLSLSQGILPGTGLLSGTPTSGGTFTFTLQITDSAGATASAQFQLTITGGGLSIVSAASYLGGKVSPGEIISIFGSFPGPSAPGASLQLNGQGIVSTTLGGMQVLFDGVAAPIVFAVQGQVNCVVPYEVSGKSSTQVQLSYQGQVSGTVAEPVTAVFPAIFTLSASGQGAVVNQDGTVNSASNPAAAGSIVSVYATGEGQTSPGGVDGTLDGAPLPVPVAQPVTATVGGVPATVKYAGGASGEVAGVLQVNVQIPAGVGAGSAVPIVLNIAGSSSQTGVTIAIH